VGGWMDHWLPTYLPTYLLSMYDQGKRVVCSAFLFLFRRWKGGYGPMKRGGRCGCGCGWIMLRGGGGGGVGEDEMSVDVLFCEGGVSGMELGLVVGGCESIERG